MTFLYWLYSPKIGNRASRSFFNSDLAKLVTIRPEQGFRQVEVSTGILLTHSRSCWEVQRVSWNIFIKVYFMLFKKVNLMKDSDIERHTSTFLYHSFKMVSRCTVDQGFFILTLRNILVQSKI